MLRLFKAPYSREHKIPPKASFLKEMCCLHLPPEGTRVKNGLKAERVCARQKSLSAVFMDVCGVLMELGLLSRMKPRYLTLLTISSGCLCQRWAPSSLRHWGGGEDTEEEVRTLRRRWNRHNALCLTICWTLLLSSHRRKSSLDMRWRRIRLKLAQLTSHCFMIIMSLLCIMTALYSL